MPDTHAGSTSSRTANRTSRGSRGARRTPEQRAAAREERASQVSGLLEQLAGHITTLTSRTGWMTLLSGAVVFYRYSLNNQLLLLLQAAQRGFSPTQVAGYQAWRDRGRQVRRGERGLQILAPLSRLVPVDDDRANTPDDGSGRDEPRSGASDATTVAETADGPRRRITGFKVIHVWDVTQTDPITDGTSPVDGDDEQALTAVTDAPAPVTTSRPDFRTVEDLRLELDRQAAAAGYQVTYVAELPGGSAGYTSRSHRSIVIKQSADLVRIVEVLAHELAHIVLGHTADDYDHHAYNTDPRVRGRAEVEAESVAYVVLGAHGVDAGPTAVHYVAGWAAAVGTASEELLAEVRATAEKVTTAARSILTAAEPDEGDAADADLEAPPAG